MTAAKTNEIANLARSLKRIVGDSVKVTTKTGNGSSALVIKSDAATLGGYGPYYVCSNGKGYTVTDGDFVHFLEDAEAVKGFFRSIFDE